VDASRDFLYSLNGSNTQVLDGTTHAVLATIAGSGPVEEDTLLNRFYIGTGTGFNIYDGLTNSLVDSVNLPAGQSLQTWDMEDGSHRLYVITCTDTSVDTAPPLHGARQEQTLALPVGFRSRQRNRMLFAMRFLRRLRGA
jgi:hypothetical protein